MAEESLNTVLGFEATNAIKTLKSLEAGLAGYTAAMRNAASATRAYNKAAKGIDTQLANQSKTVKRFATTQAMATTQTKKSKTALQQVGAQATGTEKKFRKLAKTTQKSSQQMILSWQSVIRIFTIQVIHQMISKIVSSLHETSEAARKFEIAIAEVETIAESIGLTFGQLAKQAREAAIAMGQPLDIVAEAQYQLFSNQVGNATESLLAFEASQKIALAGVTPLNSAVALLTGTLNAYGESAAESAVFGAKFFKTVELGRIRIGEMGDTLGRVTVLGAQLGISLDEILASIATLTIQGVKAHDAMTQILNIQLKLIRPTDALKQAMASLGIVSAEAGIQAYGFQVFLQKLRDTTDGTATSVGELFGRVRATRAELGLTGRASAKYEKNLTAIKEATADLLDQKLELIFRTNAKQVEVELNRLNVQLTENFGRGINKILKETFDIFGGATETLQTFGLAAAGAATTFLVLRSGILYTIPNLVGFSVASSVATHKLVLLKTAGLGATVSIKGLRVATLAFLATPMGAAIAAAAVIGGLAFAYHRASAAAKEYYEDVKNYSEARFKRELKDFSREYNIKRDIFNKELADLQKHLTKSVKLEADASKKAKILETRMHDSILEQIKNRTSAIETYASALVSVVDNLSIKLKTLREDSSAIKRTIESFKFDREIKGMGDLESIHANIKESQKLRYRAQTAIRKGEIELGKIINKQAQQYATQALSSADTLKNRGAIYIAEKSVLSLMNDELDFNRQIARQERVKVARADKSQKGLFKQVGDLQSLTKQYKDLGTELSNIETTDLRRTAIVKEQLTIGRQITKEFAIFRKRGPEAKALGLEDTFRQAVKAFREPITGMRMDLSDAIIFDAIRIAEALQITLDAVGKEAQIRVEVITGEKTPTKQVKALTRITDELIEDKKARIDSMKDQETINTLWNKTKELAIATTDELVKQENLRTKVVRFAREATAKPGFDIGFDPAVKQFQTLAIEVADLIEKGGDIGIINEKLMQLRGIEFNMAAQGLEGVAVKAEKTITALEDGRDAFVNIKDASAINLSPVIQAFDASTTAIRRNTRAALENQRALQWRPSPRKMDTPTYRQYGGFMPRGTDTIPAMLSPGEFVVNAKSTRQFFSQLIAINSGNKPIYRQEGGPVTNVGDISINIQGAPTPKQTARETMTAFRREMRRRTSSLGDS